MASHFARWIPPSPHAFTGRLPPQLIVGSEGLPERRRGRFLAARALLAELMLHVYGMPELPPLTVSATGRPAFSDPALPDFSIAYAGNVVGVLLADEGGRAGLDMEIVRAHSRQTLEQHYQHFTSAELAWINAQSDPAEAATQIWTLRQSILKLTGEQEYERHLQLHPASGRLRAAGQPPIQVVSDAETLLVWSCAFSPENDRLRLWEYQGGRRWAEIRMIARHPQEISPRALRLTSQPLEKSLHY
ncbi:4'-phosphopantetheinyl transferase superfamily protein [Pantoea sp. 1.19]|uniref:4'-phosphopantetheinyl transferase family protein n=1 Tax=Pantoea sp. 1.19 TaxID=1925589 RepID=UPI000948C9BB|nr:4'-phosphopantetheinyl transferase superfamily protein [Pantoea sp. 1.19]